MRFEPAGLTDDPDIRMAQSIMDYIFRRLALDYLPFDDRARRSASTPPRSGPRSSRPARTTPSTRSSDDVERGARDAARSRRPIDDASEPVAAEADDRVVAARPSRLRSRCTPRPS